MSLLSLLSGLIKTAPAAKPADHTARVRAGEVVLVDVREPSEWRQGVLQSAALLPLSDLRGDRTHWRAFLEQLAGKEVLVYCASGMRSGVAAHLLQKEGLRATNAGAMSDWAKAGWAVVSVDTTRG